MRIYLYSIILFVALLTIPLQTYAGDDWKQKIQAAVPYVMETYSPLINEAAWEFNISPKLIAAILLAESLGDPKSVSPAGAKGLMQTMPIIDEEVGIHGDSFDPKTSIRKGSAFLTLLYDKYNLHSLEEVIAGYYMGPSKPKRLSKERIKNHFYVKSVLFASDAISKYLATRP